MLDFGKQLGKIEALLQYYASAQTIYHIQSPKIFDFIKTVFDDNHSYYAFDTIHAAYHELQSSDKIIPKASFADKHHQSNKSLADFARVAASPLSYCYALFRLVELEKPKQILELGSCVGLSSLSLALPDEKITVHTVEANPFLVDVSRGLHKKYHVQNVQVNCQLFDEFLEDNRNNKYDLIVIDGDHQFDATLRYVKICESMLSQGGIILLDDIHWSSGMYSAWKKIVSSGLFNTSLELFRWGILFKDKRLTNQQHVYIDYKYKPWQLGLFA
ncbi:MAG: class I SAM-dependent methyltransferase [Saprospiraceae bacterium]|nr:class I SAM-dependent methyltransferase [Saprospiraceae bacterium]